MQQRNKNKEQPPKSIPSVKEESLWACGPKNSKMPRGDRLA